MDLLLTHDHQKSRNTTSEYIVQNLAIIEILITLSEFNQTAIHRCVCQFYILCVTLWMHIKKHIMRENKKVLVLQHKYNQITWKIQHHIIKFWKRLYALKWTLSAMKLLMRSHSFDFWRSQHSDRNSGAEPQTNRFCKSSYDDKEQLNWKQHTSWDFLVPIACFLYEYINNK